MGRYSLFLGLLLLLFGCAEIVPLTGGPADERAAVPVQGTQNPEQGALHVNQNELTVKFNEYFTLNDPANTAVMNPAAGKLDITSNKRELSIKWDSTLQANTTYIIQLNGTIKDLNEKNDTIHQFVFSTGDRIDSLKINGVVTDAFSNKPSAAFTIGLYDSLTDPYQKAPTYICKSNAKGEFEFAYLKEGRYQLFAFLDSNKDRLPSIGENMAYTSKLIASGDSIFIHILASKPKSPLKQLQVKLLNPGTFYAFGKELNEADLSINSQPVRILKRYAPDSLLAVLPIASNEVYTFIDGPDTITKIIPLKDRSKNFSISNKVYKNTWLLGDTLLFETNEQITQVDTSLIVMEDKTKVKIAYDYSFSGNQVRIIPKSATAFELVVNFKMGALKGSANQNDSIKLELKTVRTSDLSNLQLNIGSLKGRWVIQLMDGTNPIRTFLKTDSDSVINWLNLIPAVYQVLCIRDVNGNGKWDAGNWEKKTQPEEVVRFDLKSKLRPNWDIEETLELKTDE
ncbi:Ig-like domain-containing protein [Fluviicola chungangensis]|uniref:SbsA Ig-like domain-containing protein n=1 Tax=Fluviicola chungangensis TaxID=2597671 RepID=A0A556N3A7_9FLAO|nr:Ig-like domain-containing protein [Fluviicola chungangensis]TSJ46687.1 hypothetical protein FO442_05875 [Fluviicola chungangensis]